VTGDQKKAAEDIRMQKMQKGPLVFAAVRKEGFGSFPKVLLTQLLYQMFAALLLTWMLLQTTGLSYARRLAFLAVAGLAASVIAGRCPVTRLHPSQSKTLSCSVDQITVCHH